MLDLTPREAAALHIKARTGRHGNYSPGFFASLVAKGMIEPDTRRLTEAGKMAVEAYRRAG